MSETKFTPGPWTTVRLKDGELDSYVVGHKRGGIAKMILCSDYQKETADANARLLAAAPELYEALSELYIQCLQHDIDADMQRALENSAAVLAKACGE